MLAKLFISSSVRIVCFNLTVLRTYDIKINKLRF